MKHGKVKVKYKNGKFGVRRYFMGFPFGYYSEDGSRFYSNGPYWRFEGEMNEEQANQILDEGTEQLKQDR